MAIQNIGVNTKDGFLDDHNIEPIKMVRAYRKHLEQFPDKWKERFTKQIKVGADGTHNDYFQAEFSNEEIQAFCRDHEAQLNMRQVRKGGDVVLTWHPRYLEAEYHPTREKGQV